MSEDYKLNLFKLPEKSDDIFNYELNINFSNSINVPLLSLGFNFYYNQTKDKMEIMNDEKISSKKDLWLITNPFEHKIYDSNFGIESETKKIFNLKNKKILSRAFYKIWEILIIFDILPKDRNIVTAHLAEGPGSFVQGVFIFRDFYHSNVSNTDKYCAITLVNKDKESPNLDKKKLECFTKNNIDRYYQHKTDKNDNGDLTNINIINNFSKEIDAQKDKAYLVTADGGFVWKDENNQEQEMYNLLIGEIITAVKIQKENGTFILKIFDLFTNLSLKILCILQSFYKDVYIFKPFLSRQSNSEKYVICKNFKSDESKINKLENILKEINNNKDKYIFDISTEFKIPIELTNKILEINQQLCNKQYISINKMLSFIESKNYFSEKYHEYKEEQNKATKFWLKNFYIKNLNNKVLKVD